MPKILRFLRKELQKVKSASISAALVPFNTKDFTMATLFEQSGFAYAQTAVTDTHLRKKSYKIWRTCSGGKNTSDQGLHLQIPAELVPLFAATLKSQHYGVTLLLSTAEVPLFHRRELVSRKDDGIFRSTHFGNVWEPWRVLECPTADSFLTRLAKKINKEKPKQQKTKDQAFVS